MHNTTYVGLPPSQVRRKYADYSQIGFSYQSVLYNQTRWNTHLQKPTVEGVSENHIQLYPRENAPTACP